MDKKSKKNFKCDKCEKIFQTPTQLGVHINTQHEEKLFKRGRPKKYPYYFSSEKEIEFIQFFLDEKRKKDSNIFFSKKEISDIIFKTIKSLYISQEKSQYKIKILEKNFSNNLVLNCIYQKELTNPLNKRTVDEVLYEFFLYSENYVNKKEISLIFKFLIFFQDFLNFKFSKRCINDYTSLNLPKEIPLYIEEFIVDYLSFFPEMNLEEKEEISALAEYFANWLTRNEYSHYILINSNKFDN